MSKNYMSMRQELGLGISEPEIAFPISEFKMRLNKIRKVMERENIDLLYITDPENIYYISGYHAAWYTGHSSTVWEANTAYGIAIHIDHDDYIFYNLEEEEGVV